MVCYLNDRYITLLLLPNFVKIMETHSACSVMSKLIPVPELDAAHYVP
jgi:hypothetical protein